MGRHFILPRSALARPSMGYATVPTVGNQATVPMSADRRYGRGKTRLLCLTLDLILNLPDHWPTFTVPCRACIIPLQRELAAATSLRLAVSPLARLAMRLVVSLPTVINNTG